MASLAEIKARARRAVHTALSVAATYYAPDAQVGVTVTLRPHNRQTLSGSMGSDGYAEMIECMERCVFSNEDLQDRGVSLTRGGRIVMPEIYGSQVFVLNVLVPSSGPINVIWEVTRGK